MAKIAIKKASTDVTVYLFIQASNVTTGAGLTGLTFETANLVASYVRPLAARAALSLATQTVEGAHSDGGFVEVDATNMPGIYRLDLPDAVCAAGVDSVVVMLKGAANMSPVVLEIQLLTNDPNDMATAAALATVDDLVDDLETRLTAARAGYLDNLSGGAVALEATLTAIKGAGWTNETLVALKTAIAAIATWASAAISASYTAGAISDIRGSSWSIPMPDLTLDANKQQFSIKRNAQDLDEDAILFVDSKIGLITLNGVSTGLTAGDASLVYAGTTLTLTVKTGATAQLPVGTFHYGIQSVTAAGVVEENYGGTFTITADIVRATA